MSTKFRLYQVEKKDLYGSKTLEERIRLRKEMVLMAEEVGVKPAARYFNTYPSTVRRWVSVYREQGLKGLEKTNKIRKEVK